MLRGISFEISQDETDTLWRILQGVEVERYYWYNVESQNEVWTCGQNEALFNRDLYDGKEFLKLVQMPHNMIFLKLQVYRDVSKLYDIHTYEEFLHSECWMILLAYDCKYVEIYAKEAKMIEQLYKDISRHFSNVSYITDNDNGRTRMDVL